MILFLAIPGCLAVLALSEDSLVSAQSGGALAPLLAGHFFEPVLDYLLVFLLALGGYGWLLSRRSQRA